MSESEIFEKVKGIVIEGLGLGAEEGKVKMESTFIDDLSADSLDLVELVMSLEEEFGLEIPDENVEKIATVGDVVDFIKENLN